MTGFPPGAALAAAAELADTLAELGPVSVTRYFGGAGLRLDGVQFGFVMGTTLYLRVDDADRADPSAEPFRYEAAGRTVTVDSHHSVPLEVREDGPALLDRVARAVQAARAARRSPVGRAR